MYLPVLALLVSFLLLRMLLPLLIPSGNDITVSDDVQASGYVLYILACRSLEKMAFSVLA